MYSDLKGFLLAISGAPPCWLCSHHLLTSHQGQDAPRHGPTSCCAMPTGLVPGEGFSKAAGGSQAILVHVKKGCEEGNVQTELLHGPRMRCPRAVWLSAAWLFLHSSARACPWLDFACAVLLFMDFLTMHPSEEKLCLLGAAWQIRPLHKHSFLKGYAKWKFL